MAPQDQTSVIQEYTGRSSSQWVMEDVLKEQVNPLGIRQTGIYGTCTDTHTCIVNTVCKHTEYLKHIVQQRDVIAVITI